MQLHTAIFDQRSAFPRLARALAASVARNSPRTPLEVHAVGDDPDIVRLGARRKRSSLTNNVRKTRHHRDIVHAAADGELVGLLDADTLVLGDLAEVERYDFDLAITAQPADASFPYNSGVVFVRVSPLMRQWYDDWLEVALGMLAAAAWHSPWSERYGGINQCALGCLLESGLLQPKVVKLPCAIWNSTHRTWGQFSERTKIVHVLGRLRAFCLRHNFTETEPELGRLARVWAEYDQEAPV